MALKLKLQMLVQPAVLHEFTADEIFNQFFVYTSPTTAPTRPSLSTLPATTPHPSVT